MLKNNLQTKVQLYTAFTLAEVLIVLGIIGIVCEMTIPTLMQETQKQQFETQLEKAYSTMTQFFKLYMTNEGCSDLMCTGLFDSTIDNATWQNNMEAVAKKYFKVIKTCKTGDTSCSEVIKSIKGSGTDNVTFDTTTRIIFVLSDGTIVSFYNAGCSATSYPDVSKMKNFCAWLAVDVNGVKSPNTFGKDAFGLGSVSQNGDIYPDTSIEWAKATYGASWATGTQYWRNSPSQCGEPGKILSETTSVDVKGQNCFARILENNWVIDYY